MFGKVIQHQFFVEQHWVELMTELDFGSFMKILSKHDLEDNIKEVG